MRLLGVLVFALVVCLTTFLVGALIAGVTRSSAERRSPATASTHSAAMSGTTPHLALAGTALSLPELVVARTQSPVRHETARPAPTVPFVVPQVVAPPAAPPPPPPLPSQPSRKAEPETETAKPLH
jgi:hypothetical protein